MEAFLTWLLEQAPVVAIMGYWIFSLKQDVKHARERADKKEDAEKQLWERVIEVMSKATLVFEGSGTEHKEIKDIVTQMRTDLQILKEKMA